MEPDHRSTGTIRLAVPKDLRQMGPSGFCIDLTVSNELGLHARPAAMLAQTAQRYRSIIHCHVSGKTADAKSILDILSLAANQGSSLRLTADGPDARQAVSELAQLIRRQFREEDA